MRYVGKGGPARNIRNCYGVEKNLVDVYQEAESFPIYPCYGAYSRFSGPLDT